ncbi:MAG: 30S ribosomal protein S16 [Phycisphaerales bacterium]|nr:30S ribosomal protein S16 [Phycisphaerales bacterium]
MVVIRLKKMGRAHSPFYRLCAMDKRSPRDGRAIEQLGWYDPTAVDGKQYLLHADRVRHWLSVGAQPSQTAITLLRRVGIDPVVGKGRRPIKQTKQVKAKKAD